MANLISQLKFTLAPASDDQNFVPLRYLLAENIETKDNTRNAIPAEDIVPVEDDGKDKVKSRRASRKQRKSKSSPKEFNSNVSPKDLSKIRVAQIKEIQRQNQEVLRQLDESLSDQDIGTKTAVASPDAEGIIAELEKNPNDQKERNVKTPVILGMVDFLPCFIEGRATPALNSLEFKRAIRMLNIDLQTQDSLSDRIKSRNEMPAIEIAQLLSDHLRARADFLNSLKIDDHTFPDYLEVLGNLGLVDRSTSTTEILYTIIRDLAASIKYGTPNLQELPDRFLEAGRALPPPAMAGLSFKIYDALTSPFGPAVGLGAAQASQNKLRRVDMSDSELFAKCISSVVGRETLFSQNIASNIAIYSSKEAFDSDAETDDVAIDRNLIDPNKMLDVLEGAHTLIAPWERAGGTARGIAFKDRIDPTAAGVDTFEDAVENTAINFPYERSSVSYQEIAFNPHIGSSRPTNSQTNGAPQFVRRLYNSYLPGSVPRKYTSFNKVDFDSTYEATADSMRAAFERSFRIIAPIDETNSSIPRPLLEVIRFTYENISRASASTTYSVVPKVFEHAAKDESSRRLLLIYLAFRQEKKLQYTGVGPAPSGASQLLRKSGYLKADSILRRGSSKTIRTQTIDPSQVSVNPAIGGQNIFTSPERRTTIGLEMNAADSDSGTLESIFGITFEEVAEAVANYYFSVMRAVAPTDDATTVGPMRTSESEGYDQEIRLNEMKRIFRITDDSRSLTEDMFDCCLRYEEYMNGEDDRPIYDNSGKTYFSMMDREALFSAFVHMTCFVQTLILPQVGLSTRVPLVALDTPQPAFSIAPRPRTKVIAKLIVRKLTGYAAKTGTLRAFLDDPGKLSSELGFRFPELSRVYSSLQEESQFLYRIFVSLHSYFDSVSYEYGNMKRTLDAQLTDRKGLPIGDTLGQRVASGLVPSKDVVKLLLQYPQKLNSTSMFYNRKKVNDNTVANRNFGKLTNALLNDEILSDKNSGDVKVFCVGLPAGILEDLEISPLEIDDIQQNTNVPPDVFNLVIQKIDETQPNVTWEELEFPFSRALFSSHISKAGMQFTVVDNDLRMRSVGENIIRRIFSSQGEDDLGEDIISNHKRDHFLKQYLDLQHDLDLHENAFPSDKQYLNESISEVVPVPSLADINLRSLDFLSGSNMAFSPDSTAFESMPFFDRNTRTLDITKKSFSDPYRYSSFDYANTYGVLFDGKTEAKKLSKGAIFEKTLCVAFKDDDFEIRRVEAPDIDTSGMSSAARAEADKQNEQRAWDQAHLVADSTDTKMITYRAYISLTSKSLISDIGSAV